jgi:predicted transcriptional regulator
MVEASEAARILASSATVSDKIRRLNAAGYPRAEIARLLGKRYQHVRNVLEGDKASGGAAPPAVPLSGFAEAPTRFKGVHRLVIGPDGSLQLPAEVLAHEGWEPGRVVMATYEDDRLTVITARASIRRAQERVRAIVGDGTSLVEELLADRRREAQRESEGG